MTPRALIAIPACLLAAAASAQTPGFWLTGLARDTTDGGVTALTQDGSMAVGGCSNPLVFGYAPGFTWTRETGRSDFGLLPGMPATTATYATSSNGTVIAGQMRDSTHPYRAFLRMGTGPLQDLGVLANETRSYAEGLSGDGTVAVGRCEHTVGGSVSRAQAMRWTQATGMQSLGYLRPSGTFSEAKGISRDGSTVVGSSQSGGSFGDTEAFRWTESQGMQVLSNLPGGSAVWSIANAVDADGSVIVGSAYNSAGNSHAVRWLNGQIQDLGSVGLNATSYAYAVSDDGNVVGGASGLDGFLWTPATGMMGIAQYLARFGLAAPLGYQPDRVLAVSGDGLSFAGIVVNLSTGHQEGFVATIPSPGSLLVLAFPALARRRPDRRAAP